MPSFDQFDSATELTSQIQKFMVDPQGSPHFSHWEFTGNPLQRIVKAGPRVARMRADSQLQLFGKLNDYTGLEDIDAGSLISVIGGGESYTKALSQTEVINILRENASGGPMRRYKTPWVFRCVTVKSKARAAVPWTVRKGETELDKVISVIQDTNPESNWNQHIADTGADMDLYGVAYWLKIKTGGKVTAIQRLNPSTMRLVSGPKGIEKFIQRSGGGSKEYRRDQIVYFNLYDPGHDLGGVAPLEACQTSVDIEIEADNHLKSFFVNKAMPDYVFSMETTNPRELARMSVEWKRQFAGTGNQHKTGFIGGGAVPKELGFAPKDLALDTVRKNARTEIAAAFGVPAALIGAMEAANYATLREQRRSLYIETIIPEMEEIEDVINAELIPDMAPGAEFEFLFDDLSVLQEDHDSKAKRHAWLVEAGIIRPAVAAVALGFKPEDVPELPPPPKESDNNNFAREGNDVGTPLRQDKRTIALTKWRRKSIKRMKRDESPQTVFHSQNISHELHEEIYDQLGEAKTREDVDLIFETARTIPETEVKQGMDWDKFMQAVLLMQQNQQPVQVFTGETHQEYKSTPAITVEAPHVDVHVPQQEPPKVDVTVEAPDVTVAAPSVTNVVDTTPIAAEQEKARKAKNKANKIKGRKEKTRLIKDNTGTMTGSETDVEYEYE